MHPSTGQLASAALFATYAQDDARYWYPYMNEMALIPSHFIAHELCNYILGALTLWNALRHKHGHLWVAFLFFGFSMEVVGILVGSHAHPQFCVQLMFFCPLKEAIWYAMTMWSSWFLASSLRLSPVSEAMLAALLLQCVNIPYETSTQRPGISIVAYNVDFEMANVRDTWLQAPVINILANFIMPTFVAVVVRLCKRKQLSAMMTLILVSCCSPLCAVGFAPMNMMKFVGCTSLPLPELQPSLFQRLYKWYTTCMIQSTVTETAAWATHLIAYGLVVFREMLHMDSTPSMVTATTMDLVVLGFVMLAQIIEWMCMLCVKDSSSAGSTVVTLIAYANIAGVTVCFLFFVGSRQAINKIKKT